MEDLENKSPSHATFRPKKLTVDDIRNGCINLYGADDGVDTRICVMNEELRQGIDIVTQYKKSITIFGSARTAPTDPYYEKAQRIANRAALAGYAVITGGGPGIMEAGNRGAHDANGTSIGMTIKLPNEQMVNPYITEESPFYFFFTRKTAMRYSSHIFLFFPGGFGTLDELFETLTLVQTNKIEKSSVIMVGTEFWNPLDTFICEKLMTGAMIGPNDTELYTITDDEDLIQDMITESQKNA